MEQILAPIRAAIPETTTDVMVLSNGFTYVKTYENIYERKNIGKVIAGDEIESLGYMLASYNNIEISTKRTIIECDLPSDKTRCTIIYPPQMPQASMYLRFHHRKFLSCEALLKQKFMTEEQLEQIKGFISDRKHIVISGGTGSGKTTLLSAILAFVDPNEHLVVIENETREIICNTIERISPFMTNDFETGTDAVHAALRMDPDRIIYGEVRDGSALELCKAWNTGHSGGMTTLHCDGVDELYGRLADMVSEVSMSVPERTIRHAMQAVIHIGFKDNRRQILEIKDFTEENKKIFTEGR